MPVHLMGPNPLHLNLLQGTLITAGWSAAELHLQPSVPALEQALQAAPRAMLVMDLGDDDEATETLQNLSRLTRQWPLLQVLLLSNQRHEKLLLQAMRSGVREVLDSPPEPQELLQALQRLGEAASPGPGKAGTGVPAGSGQVLAFVASKGGNGNTLLASNLAWLLAVEFERSCTVLDLDLLYGDASFYLGGGNAQHSIASLMRQGDRLDAQLVRSSLHLVRERLHLLAAPSLPDISGLPQQPLHQVLGLLRQQQDVVVIDVPRHLDEFGLQALGLADQVIVLMRNRVPDVRNAQRLMRMLRERGIPADRLRPVLNRHTEQGGLERAAIDKALEPKLTHLIADDPAALQACVHLGIPLHEHAPGSPVLRDLRLLASAALSLPLPPQRGWLKRWIPTTR